MAPAYLFIATCKVTYGNGDGFNLGTILPVTVILHVIWAQNPNSNLIIADVSWAPYHNVPCKKQ